MHMLSMTALPIFGGNDFRATARARLWGSFLHGGCPRFYAAEQLSLLAKPFGRMREDRDAFEPKDQRFPKDRGNDL